VTEPRPRACVVTAAVLAAVLGAVPWAGTGAHVAQSDSVPPERLRAREWFQDAAFGLFVHWGVYSQLGQGEWVMQQRAVPVGTYEWLASAFNPVRFDARRWVEIAKAAGVRYITITARHHDGFSMFASDATPYDIADWTPFARDPLAELAAECRRQGLKLFFYYSQLDWHHPDYWPRGNTGRATGRPEHGEWSRYLDFMDRQLEELLTNYGPIGGIWFDGMWDKPLADWRLTETYARIHELQPQALVIPNHHQAPLPGEDVQTFEQDLPGANTAGFNTAAVGTLPLETALTMNRSWGFSITDRDFKSVRELIHYLVRAAGAGANLLLNVGPRPDGTIQPEAVDRLEAVGRWLDRYGSAVYGTRAGPVPPRAWGATTRRGDSIYVHVLDWPDRALALPSLDRRVAAATMLTDGTPVDFAESANGLVLTLPPGQEDEPDRVVVLRLSPGARSR
jgi:alpha-L-fucosidase